MRTVAIAGVGNVVGALMGSVLGGVVGAWVAIMIFQTPDLGALGDALVGGAVGAMSVAVVMGALGSGALLHRAGAMAVRQTAVAVGVLNMAWLPIAFAVHSWMSQLENGSIGITVGLMTLVYFAIVAPTCARSLAAHATDTTHRSTTESGRLSNQVARQYHPAVAALVATTCTAIFQMTAIIIRALAVPGGWEEIVFVPFGLALGSVWIGGTFGFSAAAWVLRIPSALIVVTRFAALTLLPTLVFVGASFLFLPLRQVVAYEPNQVALVVAVSMAVFAGAVIWRATPSEPSVGNDESGLSTSSTV